MSLYYIHSFLVPLFLMTCVSSLQISLFTLLPEVQVLSNYITPLRNKKQSVLRS